MAQSHCLFLMTNDLHFIGVGCRARYVFHFIDAGCRAICITFHRFSITCHIQTTNETSTTRIWNFLSAGYTGPTQKIFGDHYETLVHYMCIKSTSCYKIDISRFFAARNLRSCALVNITYMILLNSITNNGRTSGRNAGLFSNLIVFECQIPLSQ